MDIVSDERSSRNRRRGGNKDRVFNRRMWTIKEEECLIAGLKSLVASGWKCDNGFRNGYLAQLEAHMAQGFPHCDIKAEPHITSKLHVWKKHYSTLSTMMTKRGLSWDDSRNMVTIDDDNAWEEYVKMDPSAKGMRNKSFPFFNTWREVFGKDRATGERAADGLKHATEIRLEEQEETQDCYIPTAEWNPDIGYTGEADDPHPSANMTVDPTINSSSATKRTGSSSRKRKLDDPNSAIPRLVEMVSTFCETVNTRLGMLTRVLETEFGDPDQRDVIMQQVRKLDCFNNNEHLMVANRLVKDSKELRLFLGLSKESRIDWVKLMLAGKV